MSAAHTVGLVKDLNCMGNATQQVQDLIYLLQYINDQQ